GRFACVIHGRFAGDELGMRGLDLEILASEHLCCSGVVGQTGGVSTGLHAGDHEGDALVLANGLAEGSTGLCVLHRFVHAALGCTCCQGGDGNTSLIKNFQEVGVAAASLSKQVFLGN